MATMMSSSVRKIGTRWPRTNMQATMKPINRLMQTAINDTVMLLVTALTMPDSLNIC